MTKLHPPGGHLDLDDLAFARGQGELTIPKQGHWPAELPGRGIIPTCEKFVDSISEIGQYCHTASIPFF